MRQILRRLWRRTDGATAVEYAVMLALILMVVFGAVAAVGTKTSQSWTNSANSMSAITAS
jgi:pilus assembly protein Flp/PilA